MTAVRCRIVRGFVKEVEEEVNKFLSSHEVCVVHMAQSESRDHISVTLLFVDPTLQHLDALGGAAKQAGRQ